MEQFSIKNLGPISEASVEFGDLTFLVGPQATGKSLFLETLKLIIDRGHIVRTLDTYSYATGRAENILNAYYGDGMSKLWRESTSATYGEKTYCGTSWLLEKGHEPSPKESLLYVPAQRILSLSDGRPKNFMEFDAATPYVLRHFSETLRMFFGHITSMGDRVIQFKSDAGGAHHQTILYSRAEQEIFNNADITIEEERGQKQLFQRIGGMRVPFMSWSAGQKEFMPLLFIFYRLVDGEQYKYIIIEEPEMGLHPRAINTIILQMLIFMQAGYRIIVSTHSPMFLEFAWAFNFLQSLKTARFHEALAEILSMDGWEKGMTDKVSTKQIKTYFFQRNSDGKVSTDDISSLDVDDDDTIVSEWGGLSSFASKASEVVSKYAPDDE
ncbi:hypothetical protein BHU16_04525 [Tannerella sp. oral taxon 808]|nr:hypothetical protein BHU16_04525 [Tannerella sp. oral taxon 808]